MNIFKRSDRIEWLLRRKQVKLAGFQAELDAMALALKNVPSKPTYIVEHSFDLHRKCGMLTERIRQLQSALHLDLLTEEVTKLQALRSVNRKGD